MTKLKKRLLISTILNVVLVLLLTVAVGEAQRNRRLYIDEEAQNGLLTQEVNNLKSELKKFGVEYDQ